MHTTKFEINPTYGIIHFCVYLQSNFRELLHGVRDKAFP